MTLWLSNEYESILSSEISNIIFAAPYELTRYCCKIGSKPISLTIKDAFAGHICLAS